MAMRRDRLTLENELSRICRSRPGPARRPRAPHRRDGQELAEAEARREIVVTAPRIRHRHRHPGGARRQRRPTVPLLSIVPAGSKLRGPPVQPEPRRRFRAPRPARAAPLPGLPVPEVRPLTKASWPASRAPPIEPGRAAGAARRAHQPVRHERAGVSNHGRAWRARRSRPTGKPVPLQPGMQLEADVLIERRRLVEWVLDPLYTLTGKWSG